jgi:single-strand DNA-binding protein
MLIVEVIGNIGADAVVKDFNGQKFISFSVAHTERYTDGQGQKRERTTWVSCLKYGESAVLGYLKKGTRVFVRGELSAKIYEANHAQQVGINCRVRELELLGGGNRADQPEAEPATAPAPAYASAPAPAAPAMPADEPDDLPF